MKTLIVAKTIIFNEECKLLRLRRSDDDDHRPGGTDLPGGRLDDGEGIIEGATREVLEEIGVSLDPGAMHLSFSYCQVAYNTDAKGDVNVVWLGFITKLAKVPALTLSHEHKSYEWLTIDDALMGNDSSSLAKFIGHVRENRVAEELWYQTSKVSS